MNDNFHLQVGLCLEKGCMLCFSKAQKHYVDILHQAEHPYSILTEQASLEDHMEQRPIVV